MKASILNYEDQIKKMEKEMNRVSGNAKLQYTVQIQTTQVDLKETELKIKTKEAEVQKSQEILENAAVLSPVTGRVQAINETGTSQDGEPAPYITIQKTGAYRVKGVLGELQRGSITEGSAMKILSRTDPEASWTGQVSLVDYENPIKNDNMGMMGGPGDNGEMTQSSQYPFYIKLDSTDGLIMGQHVYLTLDNGEGEDFDLAVDGAFLVMEEDGKAYVWAENGNHLEKREVTLGRYNESNNLYEITAGLTSDDYIAFPDASCVSGAVTSHEPIAHPEGEDMGEDMSDMGGVDEGIMPDMGDMDLEDLSQEDLEDLQDAAEDLSQEELDDLQELAEEVEEELSDTELPQETASTEGGV